MAYPSFFLPFLPKLYTHQVKAYIYSISVVTDRQIAKRKTILHYSFILSGFPKFGTVLNVTLKSSNDIITISFFFYSILFSTLGFYKPKTET